MKNKIFGLGVFICLFNQNFEKILLLKRNKEKRIKSGIDWGNIGGRIEHGEVSIDACIRETKEEIGIDLEKSKIKFIEIKESPNFTEEIHALHFIYATSLNEKSKININEESDEYQWFHFSKLPENMFDKKEDILRIAKIAKEK
jgi:ADP-ribose pyrophosphatase YjhB (NUDIX family)